MKFLQKYRDCDQCPRVAAMSHQSNADRDVYRCPVGHIQVFNPVGAIHG